MSQATTEQAPKSIHKLGDGTLLFYFAPNFTKARSATQFPLSGVVTLTYQRGTPAPESVYILGTNKSTVEEGTSNYTVSSGDHLIVAGDGASAQIEWFYN